MVGLALLLLYGREGWFGGWLLDHGYRVIFALPSMILATIFVSLPFVVREVVPVLREIGDEQEQAAATLGASSWQTFWRVTPRDPVGRRLRRGVDHRARPGRVRRGQRRFRSDRRAHGGRSLAHVGERFEAFDLVGAARRVGLALLAMGTLLLLTLFQRKETSRSKREASRRGSGTSSRSTTSPWSFPATR